MFEIYVANLGKYNEGEHIGKWIELPATPEEIQQLYIDIKVAHLDSNGTFVDFYMENGIVYEETSIHDYSSDIDGLEVGEWDSIDELNELAERLEEADIDLIEALMESQGYDISKALDKAQNGDCYLMPDCESLEEVAEQMAEEEIFSKEFLLQYVDWEAVGRELGFDGYTETKNGVVYCR